MALERTIETLDSDHELLVKLEVIACWLDDEHMYGTQPIYDAISLIKTLRRRVDELDTDNTIGSNLAS